MWFGGKVWWGLVLRGRGWRRVGTGAAAGAAGAGGAPATDGGAPGHGGARPAATPDALSPTQLMDGPSLRETGRIAVAPAPTARAGSRTRRCLGTEGEVDCARGVVDRRRAGAAPSGRHRSARARQRDRRAVRADRGCRVEVARAKQVTPPQVVADKLLLRWIIEPDGTTASTDVVATAPVDLGVMDCAKRVMSQWTFTRPRGGPMPVERPLLVLAQHW